MKLFSYLVFIPLQIVMIPCAIVGSILTAYKQILVSKRLGVSQTAIEIINGRWTMHIFGLRRDDETAALMEVLPNTSTLGLWLVLFPLWVQSRIAGECVLYPRVPKAGDETIADLVPARTQYFDAVLSLRLANRRDSTASKYWVRAGTRSAIVSSPAFGTRGYSTHSPAILDCTHKGKRTSHNPSVEVLGNTSINAAVSSSRRKPKICIVHRPLMISIAVCETPSRLLTKICLYAVNIDPTIAQGIMTICRGMKTR